MVMDIKDHGTGALVKRFLDSNPQFDSSFGSKEKKSVAPPIWDNPTVTQSQFGNDRLGLFFPLGPLSPAAIAYEVRVP